MADPLSTRREFVVPAALAIAVGSVAAVMFASVRNGHWWGDDWALYIRQAQSLLDGDPARVATEQRFTVGSSAGQPFSPELYPWGFPFVLAPFIAVVGTDLDDLVVVPVLSAAVFSCCWFALVRRRFGAACAVMAIPAFVLTPLLLAWSELIQSEWVFMALTAATLVGLDRLVARGELVAAAARTWPLVVLGIGAAACFSTRREGLAMVAAIGAAQLVATAPLLTGSDRRDLLRRRTAALAGRIVLPHAAAAAVVGLLQVVLPSTFVPDYEGTGIANIWRRRGDHLEHLAEVAGVKRSWNSAAEILGSTTLGTIAVIAFVVAAAGGTLLAATVLRRRDAHLAAYCVAALVIGTMPVRALNRYVATVGPVALLLGLVALAAIFTHLAPRVSSAGVPSPRLMRAATAVVLVVLGSLACANAVSARAEIARTREFNDAGQVEWGPEHPVATAMFDQVIASTAPDAVVAAPKARAMVLATGRRSIQVDADRPLPDDLVVDLLVIEPHGAPPDDLDRVLERWILVWSNQQFALFEPATSPPG